MSINYQAHKVDSICPSHLHTLVSVYIYSLLALESTQIKKHIWTHITLLQQDLQKPVSNPIKSSEIQIFAW